MNGALASIAAAALALAAALGAFAWAGFVARTRHGRRALAFVWVLATLGISALMAMRIAAGGFAPVDSAADPLVRFIPAWAFTLGAQALFIDRRESGAAGPRPARGVVGASVGVGLLALLVYLAGAALAGRAG